MYDLVVVKLKSVSFGYNRVAVVVILSKELNYIKNKLILV